MSIDHCVPCLLRTFGASTFISCNGWRSNWLYSWLYRWPCGWLYRWIHGRQWCIFLVVAYTSAGVWKLFRHNAACTGHVVSVLARNPRYSIATSMSIDHCVPCLLRTFGASTFISCNGWRSNWLYSWFSWRSNWLYSWFYSWLLDWTCIGVSKNLVVFIGFVCAESARGIVFAFIDVRATSALQTTKFYLPCYVSGTAKVWKTPPLTKTFTR